MSRISALVALILGAVMLVAVPAQADDVPLRLTIDNAHPLLITQVLIGYNFGEDPGFRRDLNDGWNIRQSWAALPDELKGNTAFVLHPGHSQWADAKPEVARRWVEDNLAEGRDLGIPMFVLWGESPTAPADSYEWIEKLYQTYPNFVGTVVSELTGTLNTLPKILEVAHRYGGFHVLGSMEEANLLGARLEDQAYWDSVRPYAENFIFNPKNMHENFDTSNAQALGAWLAGEIGNWGPYFDGYAYYGCNVFGQGSYTSLSRGDRCSRSQPETVYAMAMLDQWQNGATVFHLENQLDVPAPGNLYSPVFYQSILPAMRYILSHPGPTREQVLAKTKIAFSEKEGTISSLPDTVSARNARTTFFDLYEKVPDALGGQGLWYYLRSSGRYGIVPRLPKLAPQEIVDKIPTIVTKSSYSAQLTAGDAKRAFFDAKYPEISSGDAFVQRWDDQWLVYNSRYMDNVNQDAVLHLGGPDFTRLDMPEITPHTYAMIDASDHRLTMQVDDYRSDRSQDLMRDDGRRDMEFIRDYPKYAYVPNAADRQLRTTTIRVHATKRPVLTISGYDGHYTYEQQWNENTGVYTLTLKHNGVVNVDLSTQVNTDGWTSVEDESPGGTGSARPWIRFGDGDNRVIKHGHTQEVAFDGTTVQWALLGKNATVTIDGADYSGVTRATGLPNGPHTLRVDGPGVRIRDLAYVPSVEHMLTDIHDDDFSYATAAEDQDTVYGSDKWRVADGQLKLLPYVFPFFGDVSVYNTDVKAQDVVYEAKMTLLKGTTGQLMLRADEKNKTSYMLRLDPNRVGEGERASATTGDVQLILDHATQLAVNTSVDLVTGRQYAVRFQAIGDRIQAWIDGNLVIDYTVTAAQRRGAGYTGIRIAQRNGGGMGDFVLLDDVRLTDPDGTELYHSDFADWDAAKGWITEGALVFGARDTRSSFEFPWRWQAASGTWKVVNTDAFTGGETGYYTGAAGDADALVTAGDDAAWAAGGGYLYSSQVRIDDGDAAGLLFRVQDAGNLYRATLDAAHQRVTVDRRVKGEWTQVSSAAAPVDLAADRWYAVRVSARGPLITVTVNGRQALSAQDATFAKGGVGYYLPAGAKGSFDDARVAVLPALPAAGPDTVAVIAKDGVAGRHVVGYDVQGVKTAKDAQPALPETVTALYSDGTRGEVAVTWPEIAADRLAVATTPFADGQSRGKFTVEGTVEGTTRKPSLPVTVMPKLAQPITTTLKYNPAKPALPAQTFNNVVFDAGGGVTFTRFVYVRWDRPITVSAGGEQAQTLTGTIADHPWEKAKATVTLDVKPDNLALNKPVVAYGQTSNANRVPAKMVDGDPTSGWYSGGAADGAFSDGTSGSTQGSLCTWAYVDLGSDRTIKSYEIQFGENLTNWGNMFDPPYQIQVLTAAQAAAHTAAERNSSVCTRLSGGNGHPTVSADKDIWTTVSSGVGTVAAARHALSASVTARYIRVFSNEPLTAHRYGVAVMEFAAYAS
ncbi:glycosyl hydrolase family 98 C-terminal domain-containing protein [Microbispora sp. H10830]|uniref:glycosyl hydrolase family 98 C-terminal domain-containing protein n=1 Tax=Microbispora sp. H10830 TaxID=2729109 RepID=UPI0015FED130|nr:glycosyl hydrolase family 98 C-terminal domain-containing protein [Microbispora sp. H10830]